MVRSVAGRRISRPIAIVVSALLALFWVAVVPAGAEAATVGGFEIDGDQAPAADLDWGSPSIAAQIDVVRDPIGNADTTTFGPGQSESDGPSSWTMNATGTASGKSDIGNVLVYDHESGGDTWAFMAFDRVGSTGTGRYYIELNQRENLTVARPDRTVGDVRIIIGINGADNLEQKAVQVWNGSAWVASPTAGQAIAFAVNTSPIQDFFSSPNAPAGTIGANQFVELSINLSSFGLTTCPVTGFSTLNLRSQEGGENGDTSALKDLATGPVDIDSDCSAIEIVKKIDGQAGAGAAGASFLVTPDPTPGVTGGSLVVTDGGTGDADPTPGTVLISPVGPGSYTVQELAPPAGYLLPASATQTGLVAPKRGQVSVEFDDVKGQVTFTKAYEGTSPASTGATFSLTQTQQWQYDTDPAGGFAAPALVAGGGGSATVTDNGTGDGDSAIGVVKVAGLNGGTWCITETAAPTGWFFVTPVDPTCFTVGPTDAAEQAQISLNANLDPATFTNLLRTVALKVVKTGSSPGVPGSGAPLPGVTFTVFADSGDGEYTEGGEGAGVSKDTDAAGVAQFDGLDWQKTYWLLETAEPGYTVGLSPNPTKVAFTAPEADGVVVTRNVDNPREELTIALEKRDALDRSLLTGGTFQLWRDVNTDGTVDAGDVQINGDKALTDGVATWAAADYDLPWGYQYLIVETAAPAGYGLMTPNPIVVTTTAADAGTTITKTATDPRLPVGLSIVKVDQFGAPVAGAQFRLHLDDGDSVFELGAGDTAVAGSDKSTSASGTITWSGLVWGASYWVYEVAAPAGYQPMDPRQVLVGLTKDDADTTVALPKALVDPRTLAGFTITKDAVGLPEGETPTFTVHVECGVEGEFYRDDVALTAPTYSAAVTGIPVGEQCGVTEPSVPTGWTAGAVEPGTVTIVDPQGTPEQVDVTVTNTRDTGVLTLSKAITGATVPAETAEFTVAVDCLSADPGHDDYDQELTLSSDGTPVSTTAIPTGLVCAFTETGYDESRYEPVSIAPSSLTVGDATGASIVVTNARLQDTLTVRKVVTSPVTGETPTFDVTVTCPAVDYVDTFTLGAPDYSAQTAALPTGVECTVTEPAAGFDTDRFRQVSIVPAQPVTVGDDAESVVTVTNERRYGGFTVTKEVTGAVPGETATFDFTVTCTDPAQAGGAPVVRTFTLTSPGDLAEDITGIPTGYSCRTVEDPLGADAAEQWQPLGISPAVPVLIDPASAEQVTVTATNARRTGGFPVVKVATGLPEGESPEFTVTVDCRLPGQDFQAVDAEHPSTYQRVLTRTGAGAFEPVTGIPTGMTCQLTEVGLDETRWELTSITPNPVPVSTTSSAGAGVTVTNTRLTGGLTVRKAFARPTGLPAGETPTFEVTVTCVDEDLSLTRVLTLDAGHDYTATTQGIPTGWVCSFDETGLDTTRWGLVGITGEDLNDSGELVVTETAPADVVVVVTNRRLLGGFDIVKAFDQPLGLPAGEEPVFTVNVVCENPAFTQTGIQLTAGNEYSASVTGIPTQASCTVGEDALTGWENVSITPDPVTVTTGSASTVTVTVLNKRITGGIVVTKDPQGLLAGEDASFTVDLDCTVDSYDRELVLSTANGFSATVGDLPVGLSCGVSEPVVPAGWTRTGVDPAGDVDITEATVEEFQLVTVTNERQQAGLTVLKLDGQERPRSGATFELYQVVTEGADLLVGTCETGDDGTCTITVDWGSSYYWVEVEAPAGLNLPVDVTSDPVEVTAENVATVFAPSVFVDLATVLTTTPFVGDTEVQDVPSDIARVDEGDVISDRAELANLSAPAGGEVDFFLYGPFEVDTDGDLVDGEGVTCLVDGEGANLVFSSLDRPISAADGGYEAFSADLAVGGDGPLEPGLYQWVADYSGDLGDEGFGKNRGATGNCPDVTEQVIVRGGDEPGLEKTADPVDGSTVQPGATITYTVVARNDGDVAIPAEEAVVTDLLPAYLSFGAMTPAEGQPVPDVTENEDGTTSLSWQIGELAPGASVTLTYTVAVSGLVPEGVSLTNKAEFLTELDSTTHLVPEGDLEIVKAVDPTSGTTVLPGQTLTYTLRVTATGELDQQQVSGSDVMPGADPLIEESLAATYVDDSAECDGEGTCEVSFDPETGELVVGLGTVAHGTTRVVTFQVTVDAIEGVGDLGEVVNTATATSTTEEARSNDVQNPVVVQPLPTGDLGVTKAVSPAGPAEVGDTLTYTLTAAATGDLVQTEVVVTDYLPGRDPAVTESLKATLVPGSAACVGEGLCTVTVDAATGLITWELGGMAGGMSRQVTFQVTVDAVAVSADPGDVVNVAAVESEQTPAEPSNPVVTPVLVGALALTKAVAPTGGVIAGDRLTYSLTATASGNLTQTGVVVSDYVPGYDPARPSSLRTTYVPGSAACDVACTVSYDEATHQVTWALGDAAAGTARTVTFVVTVDAVGGGAAGDILNAGSVTSAQTPPTPSNEVRTPVAAVLAVKAALPVEAALPRTGAELGATLWLSAAMLILGAGLVMTSRRRRRS